MIDHAMKPIKRPVVIDPERAVRETLSVLDHFVFRIDVGARDRLRDTFMVLRSSTLNSYADLLIRAMRDFSRLRVVFVLMDTDFDSFFDKVVGLKVGSLLPKVFRVDGAQQVERVLQAWYEGLQEQRFADARVEGSMLIAKACDLTKYEVELSMLPVFRDVMFSKLGRPSIDRRGTRLTWNDYQIDLDFDTMRYLADRKYRNQSDLASLTQYTQFGEAIRQLRLERELTQESIAKATGISTRHLSRVENAEHQPTVKLMQKLSSAHKLSYEDYLRRLISLCVEMETQETARRRGCRGRRDGVFPRKSRV